MPTGKEKQAKGLRAERDDAWRTAKILAQAFATGTMPPARSVTRALNYPARLYEEDGVKLLFGDTVLVRRGSAQRTEGPGRDRYVRMRVIGASGLDCYCQLLEDDPYDTVGICHVGDKGCWGWSVVQKEEPQDKKEG